jgi:hypothetical protein
MANVFLFGVAACVVLFVIYCPILKPWFGFRKPLGHRGRWFQ